MKYFVQVNDYMSPVSVELTEDEAKAVAYVLEEIHKEDRSLLIEISEEESGRILFDNYDEWVEEN